MSRINRTPGARNNRTNRTSGSAPTSSTNPASTPNARDGFQRTGTTAATTQPQRARTSLQRDASASASASRVAAATRTEPTRTTLRVGALGNEVKDLQTQLGQLGHDPGGVDGNFGRSTRTAVRSFQEAESLEVDGVVGPKTWEALDRRMEALQAPAETPTPAPTPEPAATTPEPAATATPAPPATEPASPPTAEPAAPTTASPTGATSAPEVPTQPPQMDHVDGHDHTHANDGVGEVPPFDAPDAVLRPGASGDDVKALQERLTQLGFEPGEANGEFGDTTTAAVQDFQRAATLEADGIVGPKTWEALEAGEARPPEPLPPFDAPGGVLRQGAGGDDVKALQERLKQFGFDPGVIDGDFGRGTAGAVRGFQFAAGLEADGVVGAKTWEALEKGRSAIVNHPVTDAELGPLTTATGYVQGRPLQIQLANVDGKQLEVDTAKAYLAMKQAAARDGVDIQLVSGFRSNEKQAYLYDGWRRRLPGFNPANPPGYSNHQSGVAVDLNALGPSRAVGSGAVYNWLANNAHDFGFKRIASERWHWEYQPSLQRYNS